MSVITPSSRLSAHIIGLSVSLALFAPVRAQTPAKRHVEKQRPTPTKVRVAPLQVPRSQSRRPRKSYVRTRRDYRHVHVLQPLRHDDGRLKIRPMITRSARVTPVVLSELDELGRTEVSIVVRQLREGHRDAAMRSWRGFVQSLSECDRPINLTDVILYIGRESCLHDSGALLFHGARLEHLRESADRLEDYLGELDQQRDDCSRGRRSCTPDTVRNLDVALVRARADLRILGIEMDVAEEEMERIIGSSQEYERRFARTFEDMYREVELTIGWGH